MPSPELGSDMRQARVIVERPATVPARSAHAFLAHPTRFERVTFAFGALLLAQTSPRYAAKYRLGDCNVKSMN
jgi:hypothetical protein